MSTREGKKAFFFLTREFWSFIRVETCLFISGTAVSGYLLLNQPSPILAALFLSVFFASAGGYAYNHLVDKEEDIINDKKLNVFVTNGLGMKITIAMFAVSVFSSLFLPFLSLLLVVMSMPVIIAYSIFRVKKKFLAKNLYTGLTIGLAFMIGISAKGTMTAETLPVLFTAFLFGTLANMMGDIRGYTGDLAAGAKTLPVVIGNDETKRFVHFMFLGFSASVLISKCYLLFPFAPFGILTSLFLATGRHRSARYCVLSSFVAFSIYLLFEPFVGGD